jgi:phosphoribosylanthranilate isomerase
MLVKICGLSTAQTMEAALDAGADLVGLVFHPRSPRHVDLTAAAELARIARGRAEVIALVVDATPTTIEQIVQSVGPDGLQLHGTETPADTAAIRAATRLPVMKAIGIGDADDLAGIAPYAGIADRILLDARPPADAAYPGGHGQVFDWAILSQLSAAQPVMLSGGLTPDNVHAAIRTVRDFGIDLVGVDVSTGVEASRGVKDPHRIRDFIQAVRSAD